MDEASVVLLTWKIATPSPSGVEAKKFELSFIMTMDGINNNYIKGAVNAKEKEEKAPAQSLARRRLRVLLVAACKL